MATEKKAESVQIAQWITDIENGLLRKAGNFYSNVVVIVSNDSKRTEHLNAFATSQGIKMVQSKQNHRDKDNVYLYDSWNGLHKLYNENGEIRQEKVSIPNVMDMGVLPPLPVCKYVEGDLKTKPTILLVENVLFPSPDLHLALNSWAFDNTILQTQSTIVVVIPSYKVNLNGQMVELIPKEILSKCNVIEIVPSTKDERRSIIIQLAKSLNVALSNSDIDMLVDSTSGLDHNQLESAIIETYALRKAFDKQRLSKVKGEIISKSYEIDLIMNLERGFESVGGYDAHKKFIKESVIDVLSQSALAKNQCAELPKGVLVFGMGGTGKTILAKALAKELGIPFVSISPNDIVSKWYGESEKRMGDILKMVDELSPCLVYIDEIDTIMTKRGEGQHEATGRVLNVLMTWLSKPRNSLVWATTNCVENIDEASMRVGRFDYIIPQLLPDLEARKEILKVHLNVIRNVKHDISDADLMEIAEKTDLWAGNELEMVIKKATQVTFREAIENGMKDDETLTMTAKHLQQAFESVVVNTGKRKDTQAKYIKLAQEFANDKAFIDGLYHTNGKPAKSRTEQAVERLK